VGYFSSEPHCEEFRADSITAAMQTYSETLTKHPKSQEAARAKKAVVRSSDLECIESNDPRLNISP
jgi:hypothetical protein